MLRVAAGLALALALAASCSKPPPVTAATGGGAVAATGAVKPEDFNSQLPLKDVMQHVINYTAFNIWENQGWIIDAEGTHELFPVDDDGWKKAEDATITLAEATNLLLLPGRPQDDTREWVDHVHALRDAALAARKTVQARDKQAFFDAGGAIYQVCTDCHVKYVIGDTPAPIGRLPDFSATGIRPTESPKPN